MTTAHRHRRHQQQHFPPRTIYRRVERRPRRTRDQLLCAAATMERAGEATDRREARRSPTRPGPAGRASRHVVVNVRRVAVRRAAAAEQTRHCFSEPGRPRFRRVDYKGARASPGEHITPPTNSHQHQQPVATDNVTSSTSRRRR